jgi:phage major head subunit gpT-like protein
MLTPSQYAAFITTVDTTIGQIYTQLDPAMTYKEWSTTIPISGAIWNAGWTGKMPKARPWFGSRVVYEPAAQTYQVTPIPYELTYGIERFQFDDSAVNTTSIFWRELPDMAMQWRRQPEYELRDLLEGSGVQTSDGRQNGLDTLSAFNTSHPIDLYNPAFTVGNYLFASGTYCNDFSNGGQTINGTLIGGALSQAAFSSVLQYAQMVPGEDGEVLGVMPDAMMIPTTLQVEANFILKSTFMAPQTWGAFGNLGTQVGTADNMLAKMGVRPVVNRWLRNTKRWYLMDTSHAMKPLIWLVREAPRTVPRVNENDPIVFDTHHYTWGGWDRVAPAWNFSWLIYRSAPTGY